MANYIPSPRDWVREQVELYESSDGTEGTTLRRPIAVPRYWRQHVHKESVRNTGDPKAWSRDDQPDARGGQAGRPGAAERFVVPLKPGNTGGGKGPQFKTNATRGEGPGDWGTYQLRRVFRNCGRRCTRKRRQKSATVSMPCTTRSSVRTSWPMPTPGTSPAMTMWIGSSIYLLANPNARPHPSLARRGTVLVPTLTETFSCTTMRYAVSRAGFQFCPATLVRALDF
jgi:hypothetical protein